MPEKSRFEVKLTAEWLFDKIWPLFWMFAGGSLTTWAAYMAKIIPDNGYLSALFCSVLGAYMFLGVYILIHIAKQKKIQTNLSEIISSESHINPLNDKFQYSTIKLSDFYDPYYIGHKKKTFSNCKIVGPGLLYVPDSSLPRCNLKFCQFVIIKDDISLIGVTVFSDSSMIDCDLISCTILLSKAMHDSLPDDLKRNVQVINI